jgi:hypothetical protein
MRQRILPFLLAAFFIGFFSARALSQAAEPADRPGGQQPPSPSSPPASTDNQENALPAGARDYSQEAFVIEQLHYRMRFENDGTARKDYVLRVRVQSEAGVQRWGQLRLGYSSASERLDVTGVRVIKKDGSVVTASPDAILDLSPIQQNAQLYTDYREKHVTVPGLRPGDVLECQTVTAVHTPIAPGQFWMQYDFNLVNIVLDEQLEIDVPGGRAVKLKTRPGLEPKTTEENGRRIYRWTSSHLVREETSKSGDNDKPKKRKKKEEFPAVQLTTFSTWEDVGRWYAGLERDRRKPTKEIKSQADSLTKGLTTDLDKIQAVYDFVATNFRYVSLSLGMARYQPHAAYEVLQNQYVDCKD